MKSFIFCFLAAMYTFVGAQDSGSYKIAVMPISSEGIASMDIKTTESILQLELSKQDLEVIPAELVTEALKDLDCNSDCDSKICEKTGAAKLLRCTLAPLGEKIIIQYYLYDNASHRKTVIDQLTSTRIEELETIMKRIAQSVIDIKPGSENPQMGAILEKESENIMERQSRNNVGVSFGYLYPQNGYDDGERAFMFDFNLDHEMLDYAAGLQLSIREGFGMNLYGDYLFSKQDICPYVGALFGFHWVSHNQQTRGYYNENGYYSYDNDNKRGDGFEIGANAGIRILHTYNFQLVMNLSYTFTLNDYHDQAIMFTIGIL